MPDRNRALTLAIISGMSALAFSAADASAATTLALADEELSAVTYGITQIAQKKNNSVIIWNRALHGERCVYRIGGCRYFHQGYYYQSPWWTAPLIFGDGPGTNFYHDGDYRGNIWSGKHIAWCFNRYHSYNPRNNTWISNSGKVLQCRSPSPY